MAREVFNAFEGCVEEMANQRPSLQDMDIEVFPANSPKAKSLIEISGTTESGKSLLLWRLMVRCLTPTYFGGRNCDLIFIDLRHKFDIESFEQQILSLVAASGEQHTAAESQSVVEKCFDSMHLLNCYSSKHLKAALEIVDGLLLKHSDCSMVAIDGLDAFYWLDTYECRIRRQTHYARNVERLRKLCDRHGVCCAYTVNATYLSAKKLKDLDDNMLGRKSLQKSVKVEHKLQLQLANNGERTLNGMPVEIRQHSLFVVKQ
ncbi:DNA repair protein XRCC2 [Zeugodacus cucurbitae]|uniref:DNA repair protein XRCC2 n=1 Tax=Zeugodacus cucurbitae TaxID=28588 RepID=UPI0023D957C6|nr:DNA repair protein XRCC2 [Zeugodacus cucurbitae]XP_054089080.1 DNA repair protein XRCC2 [Zeugodacus cucurbitae]